MSIPNLMSGIQLTGHGGSECLVWNDEIPVRAPNPNEVVVRVKAAGVNNTDINTRIGWYSSDITASTEDVDTTSDVEQGGWSGALPFPLIQGGDLCGDVVVLGEQVDTLKLGMRVTCPTNQPIPTADEPTRFEAIGSEFDGAFAEYCTLPANRLFDVSDSPLNDVEIAALPCAYGTAFNLLSRAGVDENDNVLITGASGGVGLAAVQLAHLRGATVTGIASGAKQQAVRDAGASEVIDRQDTPPAATFTSVIDVVGGERWQHFINALKPGGRYAVSGAIAGPIIEADLRDIYLNDITLFGCSFQSMQVFGKLVALINDGKVKPLISKTYSLRDIGEAQEDFLSKRYPGKLVLIPPG
jgi:NADPH:quinone reductase-like Zn-dependent oxidoreductase